MYAFPSRFALLLFFTTSLPCPSPPSVLRIFSQLIPPFLCSLRCLAYPWWPTNTQWFPSRLPNFTRGRLFARTCHYQRVPYPVSYGFTHTRCSGHAVAFTGDSTSLQQQEASSFCLSRPRPISSPSSGHYFTRSLHSGHHLFPVLSRLASTRRLPRAFSFLRAGGHPCIRENVIPSI